MATPATTAVHESETRVCTSGHVGTTTVVLRKRDGRLGIVLIGPPPAPPRIKSLVDGSVAAAHGQLSAGQTVVAVNGVCVRGHEQATVLLRASAEEVCLVVASTTSVGVSPASTPFQGDELPTVTGPCAAFPLVAGGHASPSGAMPTSAAMPTQDWREGLQELRAEENDTEGVLRRARRVRGGRGGRSRRGSAP